MDPQNEYTLWIALMTAAVGIAALVCQFMFKFGQLVYHEVYLCGGLC